MKKMKLSKGQWIAAGLSLALIPGCSSLSEGENAAVFGTLGGVAAGAGAAAAGMDTGSAVLVGVGSGAAVAAVTYAIAKHNATQRQREIAEERAISYERSHRRHGRYVAVDTLRGERNKGTRSVMVYDTQSDKMANNHVYDLKQTPTRGDTVVIDSYETQYAGTGE